VGEYSFVWKEGSFVCETVWFFLWVNTHPFDCKFVVFCPKLSGDSYVDFQEKNYFGTIFQKFCANQGFPLPKLVKFRPSFCNFIPGPFGYKKFTQVLSYVVCTQVRRHVHIQITKTRYGKEKPGCFVFGKPVLITLGLGLTTTYSLGILVWNFYHTFVTVSVEFWLRFEPQIRPTRFAINFLFITAHHCQGWKEGSFVCETVWFFRGWIVVHLSWNLSRFVPNLVDILTWIFRKNYFGIIFQKFCPNQGYHLPKLVKFRPTFCNFLLGLYCAEKIHTSTFICCLHPGKEARS